MPDVFEAYNDLEEFAEQLQAADAGERRVAADSVSRLALYTAPSDAITAPALLAR